MWIPRTANPADELSKRLIGRVSHLWRLMDTNELLPAYLGGAVVESSEKDKARVSNEQSNSMAPKTTHEKLTTSTATNKLKIAAHLLSTKKPLHLLPTSTVQI